jgi:hypothetical protein
VPSQLAAFPWTILRVIPADIERMRLANSESIFTLSPTALHRQCSLGHVSPSLVVGVTGLRAVTQRIFGELCWA